MEIFVIHREFVNGHIDIAGPAFASQADAEKHMQQLLLLEEVQDATIHSVYMSHRNLSPLTKIKEQEQMLDRIRDLLNNRPVLTGIDWTHLTFLRNAVGLTDDGKPFEVD